MITDVEKYFEKYKRILKKVLHKIGIYKRNVILKYFTRKIQLQHSRQFDLTFIILCNTANVICREGDIVFIEIMGDMYINNKKFVIFYTYVLLVKVCILKKKLDTTNQ